MYWNAYDEAKILLKGDIKSPIFNDVVDGLAKAHTEGYAAGEKNAIRGVARKIFGVYLSYLNDHL